MKIVMIFGPGAVGKMSVGQELAKVTGLRLFHNHKSIEFVIDVFGFYDADIISKIRDVVFHEYLKTDNYGMIFTFIWAFNQEKDWEITKTYHELFTSTGADVYYVELEASQEIRLSRNATENRLLHKPSKRDIEISNQRLIREDSKYRCNSNANEVPFPNYMRINNENLSSNDVALLIKNKFGL